MSLHDVCQLDFDLLSKMSIRVEPVDENLSTDAGLLIFRQFDHQQRLTESFAEQLNDARCEPTHSALQIVRSRTFGILAGYPDQDDHDALRSDPVFKLLADRSPDGNDLASQPTISRFENAITAGTLLRLETWYIERFVDSFGETPNEVTLDVDVFDDPTYGEKQLTLFPGHYGQYQYLVRAITCAENDRVVLPTLLHGTADVALGLDDDLECIVRALRKKFPHVLIRLRADSGYSKPWLHELCDRLDVEFSIAIGMNKVLKRNSEETLDKAVKQFEETGQSQRLFTGFYYRAKAWCVPRWAVVKCEANAQGTNRRAVVSNRPGARTLPRGVYDEYAERGESENRNKELKCELSADRLSDHRYMANCFRMFLHCLAHNLLVSVRQAIAAPPKDEPYLTDELPAEARTGHRRRRQFNRRRQADPLGEGHACT